MNIPSPRARKRARIEIIPLIDIVFFLLATFVMVSMSMVQNQGLTVHLPKAEAGSVQDRKTSATISVREDGAIFLNKNHVGMENLSDELRRMSANDAEFKVFINADERADFGYAVRALDQARKAGITKVAIQTKKDAVAK